MIKFHELLLTFFYSGKSKKAPGTSGSLAAIIFWILTMNFFSKNAIALSSENIFWFIFLTITFIYGCLASPIYAKKLGKEDPGSIVIDEVVGQILPLQFTFSLLHENYFSDIKVMMLQLSFCFISFRFFDIAKPSIIGYCDRNFKGGFGIMFDDLLCGIITALLGTIAIKLLY